MGLPGSGKTSLARALASRLSAVHFNGDEIRHATANWKFDAESRLQQARLMGHLANQVSVAGYPVIVDFVCPTAACRTAFGKPDVLVFVDRITSSRYPDTDAIFEPPLQPDIRVFPTGSIEFWASRVEGCVRSPVNGFEIPYL